MWRLNRVARCWQTVCYKSRLVIELDETDLKSASQKAEDFLELSLSEDVTSFRERDRIKVRWLNFRKETEKTVWMDEDGAKVKFSERASYSEKEVISMKEDSRTVKREDAIKMAKSEVLDLLGTVGLLYFIVIVMGIIEFIPRPEMTWVFAPIFWMREQSEPKGQTD